MNNVFHLFPKKLVEELVRTSEDEAISIAEMMPPLSHLTQSLRQLSVGFDLVDSLIESYGDPAEQKELLTRQAELRNALIEATYELAKNLKQIEARQRKLPQKLASRII